MSVSVHVIPQFQSVRSGVDIGDSTPRGFNIALLTHFARPTGFLSEILRDGGSESSDQFRRGRGKEEEEEKKNNKFHSRIFQYLILLRLERLDWTGFSGAIR